MDGIFCRNHPTKRQELGCIEYKLPGDDKDIDEDMLKLAKMGQRILNELVKNTDDAAIFVPLLQVTGININNIIECLLYRFEYDIICDCSSLG